MRLKGAAILLGLMLSSCQPTPAPRSYLALPIHEDGRPRVVPYVVSTAFCGSSIMAVGTLHSRDPSNPQYARLEALYRSFAPTLILHENVTPRRPAGDRDSAIRGNGEIGFMQLLAAGDGVPFRSGDLPESREFEILIAKSEPLQLLVFLTAQRLLTGLTDEAVAASEYPGFYSDYLVANGFPDRDSWSSWAGFRSAYRNVIGADYDPATFDPDVVSPIRNLGPLNRISRLAHRARDEHLLREMARGASERHTRIMVVFGAWHVMALEPAIQGATECKAARALSAASRQSGNRGSR
jgi:hypothetical protein